MLPVAVFVRGGRDRELGKELAVFHADKRGDRENPCGHAGTRRGGKDSFFLNKHIEVI